MWQAPSQRKGPGSSKKRTRDRTPFHMKRVAVQIKLHPPQSPAGSEAAPTPAAEPVIIDARALLNDLSHVGMGLFSQEKFSPDDEITICFESPKKIEIKGRVAWCQEYFVMSRVIREESFSYRTGIQFKFATPEEEKAVQDFCKELLDNHKCVALAVA